VLGAAFCICGSIALAVELAKNENEFETGRAVPWQAFTGLIAVR
jgi:hypothetical protein